MGVTVVHKDLEGRSMSIESEWAAPVERVWQVWADPRRLERWWGPPTHPATVVDHDLRPGGRVTYFMTGPGGEEYHGWWTVIEVEAPVRLVIDDGFADADGAVVDNLPTTRTEVALTASSGGVTRMAVVSTFPTSESMQQLLDMGAEQGMIAAMGQIEALVGG